MPSVGMNLLRFGNQITNPAANRPDGNVEHNHRQAEIRFQTAMDSIPSPEKKEYLEAIHHAPHLVATESDPMRFIRFSDFDFGAAAKRMCSYWRHRKELFQERAFLPLTLDGNGALNYKDIQVLQAGYPVLLPPTTCGRQVILFYHRRYNLPEVDNQNRLRAIFCIANKVSAGERAQHDGVVWFSLFDRNHQPDASDRDIYKSRLALLRTAFPVRWDANGIFSLPSGSTSLSIMASNAAAMIFAHLFNYVQITHGSYYRPHIHFETTPGDSRELMLSKGMMLETIPQCCGGTCNLDKYVGRWFDEQRGRENHVSRERSPTLDQKQHQPNGKMSTDTTATMEQQEGQSHQGGRTPSDFSAAWDLDSVGHHSFETTELDNIISFDKPTTSTSDHGKTSGFGFLQQHWLQLEQVGLSSQKEAPRTVEHHIGKQASTRKVLGNSLTDAQPTPNRSTSDTTIQEGPPPRLNRSTALESFNQAMASIPIGKKKDYLEALDRCPELVATESDPMKYIRYCKFDFWEAAERLCNYWRERKALFLDKAFLPFKLNGKGAMEAEDILVIQGGFPARLPRTTCGRGVSFIDRSKYLPSTTRTNRLKAVFFMGTLASDDEKAQDERGWVFINLLIQPHLQDIDRVYMEKTFYWIKHVHPVKFDPFILIMLPKTMTRGLIQTAHGAQVSKDTFITNIISTYTSCFGSSFQGTVLFETNEGDIVNALMSKAGLTRDGIPSSVGGNWMVEEGARNWVHERVVQDCGGDKCLDQLMKEEQRRAGAQANADELRLKRRRTVNAIHSRKKRQRRRQELDMLKKECAELRDANSELKAEQSRLESLLQDAQVLVKEACNRIAQGY